MYELEQTSAGTTLVVTGPWSPAAADALARGEADGLVLNYARGFGEASLEFLRAEWGVRRLELLDWRLADLGPLARLWPSLEHLSVAVAPGAALPAGELPALRTVAGEWSLIHDAVTRAPGQLERVLASKFPERDLAAFAGMRALRSLTVQEAPYLESLGRVGDLTTLEVYLARRFSDLTGLPASLERLDFEGCRGIAELDAVAALTALRELGFSDCGDIASLQPLAPLERLEVVHAWGTTRVVDGDLSPLTRLPRLQELRMQSRRHYRPPLSEVMASLGVA